jgi:hypothetical protein
VTATVIRGEATMRRNYALEAEGVAAGYILTCRHKCHRAEPLHGLNPFGFADAYLLHISGGAR